jgi:hypothetical protein
MGSQERSAVHVKTLRVVALIGFALLVGSCAGIDRDGSADELVRTLDVDKNTARCIIDAWIDSLGEDRVLEIEGGAPPTEREEGAIVGAVTTCSS